MTDGRAAAPRCEVVVRLLGGLGNQLFQYAAGRAVAESTGGRLLLDAALLGAPASAGTAQRRFALERLGLTAIDDAIAEPAAATGHTLAERVLTTRGLWRAMRLLRRSRLRIGSTLGCFDRMDGAPPAPIPADVRRVVLTGYWQSRRCFAPIEPALRTELLARFGAAASEPGAARAAEATRREGSRGAASAPAAPSSEEAATAALHVRRGDYLDPRVARVHPPLPAHYYRDALLAIAARRPISKARLFSDDPARAQAELEAVGIPVPVEAGSAAGSGALDDLVAMSRCGALVTANSSLSWWAAWLMEARAGIAGHGSDGGRGENGGIVVAPDPWFGPAGASFAHPAPPEWMRTTWRHP
ncbi:MAG TPA: alpha-1,2-fucosyltransferase [Phycisphaerales bacterium]|nr:alpha-1,2-fucosyltransferase [Phycisphaerales bacterium]HMP38152.1 alpha-1,2-fucosyltransferase [Phycisphaerales bacterium]